MTNDPYDRSIETRRLSFLEKQNEALLRTLNNIAKKNQDSLLQLCLEQQKQILSLSQKIAILADRDRELERRNDLLKNTLKAHLEAHMT